MKKTFYWLGMIVVLGMVACHKSVEPVKPEEPVPPVEEPTTLYRIGKITLSPGRIVSFQYGANGEITQSDLTDSLKNIYGIMASHWSFVYDSEGHLDKLVSEDGSHIEVTTDSAGRVTKAVRAMVGNFIFENTFSYDSLGRLAVFEDRMMGSSNKYLYSYTLDGNLSSIIRSGSPAALNFSLQATAYDSQNSVWQTDTRSNLIYWWLVSLTYFADLSPALFLSYKNNITECTYTDLQGNITELQVEYEYTENNPIRMRSLQTIDSTTFRGPFKFEYQSYSK
ncbi:hypothetical protein [Xanthocytophaga agilis]|uniref:DUF4595 domain-containing protein n=1 Tax=Xanthocytophaga agilis TaxID=3048010 RepID=A0AAE3UHG9_9BACT|nr:hypothetical protein [Xanthocytophaga agilis]MDJ1503462.1 hypothetical protein [Xanthocytophaga agilis]